MVRGLGKARGRGGRDEGRRGRGEAGRSEGGEFEGKAMKDGEEIEGNARERRLRD